MGANWSNEGWFVPVDFITLQNQVRPKDHIELLRPFLPSKYSPLQPTGDGLQSVYLAEVPGAMAQALIGLIGQDYWDNLAAITAVTDETTISEAEEAILEQGVVGPTRNCSWFPRSCERLP